jgi:hypothetical protein
MEVDRLRYAPAIVSEDSGPVTGLLVKIFARIVKMLSLQWYIIQWGLHPCKWFPAVRGRAGVLS